MNKYDLKVTIGYHDTFTYKAKDMIDIDIIISVINEGLSEEDKKDTKYAIIPVEDTEGENE